MEVNCYSVLAIMDNLWFHQIILLAEPFSAIYEKPVVQSPSLTGVSDGHSEEDGVSASSFTSSTTSQDDNELEERKIEHAEAEIGSKSSLPAIQRPRKNTSYPNDKGQKMQRFLNSKILRDLELLELKGFLDLGFDFKDRLSPRTMNVIPGLQRLGDLATIVNPSKNKAKSDCLDGKEEGVEEDKILMAKPYLSDAWTVKKPSSPLLRLRMARVSTAQDMKNCLKLWARTVASSVQSVR